MGGQGNTLNADGLPHVVTTILSNGEQQIWRTVVTTPLDGGTTTMANGDCDSIE